MKYVYYLLALSGVVSAPLHAISLGDAIESSRKGGEEKSAAIATARVEDIVCSINEAELCTVLELPDAMSSGRYIKASKDDQVVLFISGKLSNKGKKKRSAGIPAFLSAEQKKYEGKALFFKGVSPKAWMISLNPDEEYEFGAYFYLPVTAIVGGKLVVANDEVFSKKTAEMELPFNRQTTVHDRYEKRKITDNPFDAREG